MGGVDFKKSGLRMINARDIINMRARPASRKGVTLTPCPLTKQRNLSGVCMQKKQKKPNGYWTFERCAHEAKKFQTRSEFEKKSGSAYIISLRNRWIDEICGHMTSPQKPSGYWTFCRILKEARKHKTYSDFASKCSGALDAASRLGYIKGMCSHMESPQKPKGYWSEERILSLAKECSSVSEMISKSRSAYKKALSLNLYCAFEHMKRVKSDYDLFYIWKSTKVNGDKYLCKIGVSSKRLGEDRINYVARENGLDVSEIVIKFSIHNAKSIERAVLDIGEPCLELTGNGKTEFRWMSESDLNRAVSISLEKRDADYV